MNPANPNARSLADAVNSGNYVGWSIDESGVAHLAGPDGKCQATVTPTRSGFAFVVSLTDDPEEKIEDQAHDADAALFRVIMSAVALTLRHS